MLTQAGHDPEALTILVGALTPSVEDTERFRIAVDIFGVLHDAGLRLVPTDEAVQSG